MTSSEWATAPVRLFNTRGVNPVRFTIPGPALTHTVTVGPVVAGMTLAPSKAPDDAERDQSR